MISDKLSWLGIKIDDAKNQKNEYIINTEDSNVKVLALLINEEQIIVEEVIRFL